MLKHFLTFAAPKTVCGEAVALTLRRGDTTYDTTLTPVMAGGVYKAGMWIRDSAAGIGTGRWGLIVLGALFLACTAGMAVHKLRQRRKR